MIDVPLVSIITPTFNPGKRLERCLASVSAQTYPMVEHIVVDGGSSDGTLDLLRSTEVRWVSEPDQGQSDAINKGFALAHGNYLGWLNADDVLTPGAVEQIVAAFQASPEIGWSIGDVIVRSGEQAEIERPARVEKESTWRARNIAAQPGSFIAQWALEKVGGLDPSFHFMMDLDLWLRLVDADIKHVYLPDVLAIFELHEDSKSGSIAHSEFLLEDGMARAKTGRSAEASFAYGRASAWANTSDPEKWLRECLGGAFEELQGALVMQGLRTELAILASKRSRFGIVRAMDPRLWRSGAARSRLLHAIGRELSRSRRRAAAIRILRELEEHAV